MTASATADTLSCAIAGAYAARWARSVARLPGDEAEPAAPWFVDGFAGADLQRAALRGVPTVAGSVAAIRALGEAAAGVRVVLADEDPGLVSRLADALAGTGARVRRPDDVASLQPGEIALVESPFPALAPLLADAIGDAPALVRLAPATARALPWTALHAVAALPAADLLLRFPGEDFARIGAVAGPWADFPPHLRRIAEGCSALLDDPKHSWLAMWRETSRTTGPEAALGAMVERLQSRIATAAAQAVVRTHPVEAEDGRVHLLLSTAHPAHVLELNGAVLDAGGALEPVLDLPAEPEPEPELPATLDLFPLPPPPVEPKPRGPDPAAIAETLHTRHRGTLVSYGDLLAGLADAALTPEQVRSALLLLKRGGRVVYRSLDAADAELDFLLEPTLAPVPRRRAPRRPPSDAPSLFDPPDE